MRGKLNFDKCVEIASTCACFQLRKASRAITKIYDRVLQPAGLRPNQFTILTALFLSGPKTITELAEILVMDRTTLTRNNRLLKRNGLITVLSDKDRRRRTLTLTPKGKRALEKALPYWEQAQSHVVNELGQKRWDTMREDLLELMRVRVD